MTITSQARDIQARALTVLRAEFGKDVVSSAGGKIGSVDLTLKFEFITGSEHAVIDDLRTNFNIICYSVRLVPADIYLSLSLNGQRCKLMDVSFRSPRFPFVVEIESSGKRFKATADTFLSARARAATKPAAPTPPKLAQRGKF